jgi:hypothetical protein
MPTGEERKETGLKVRQNISDYHLIPGKIFEPESRLFATRLPCKQIFGQENGSSFFQELFQGPDWYHLD